MNGNEQELRLICADAMHIPCVLSLYEEAKKDEFCVWNEHYPTIEHVTADVMAKGLYLLVRGDDVIGCVSVESVPEDDDLPWRICDGTHREVARLTIAPCHRGHGYASKMMLLLMEELQRQGARSVHLLAAKCNPPAYRTYRSLGFDFFGECYRYGTDYYICEKLLREE